MTHRTCLYCFLLFFFVDITYFNYGTAELADRVYAYTCLALFYMALDAAAHGMTCRGSYGCCVEAGSA